MSAPTPVSPEKQCRRHSWMVARTYLTILGKPMEALRCRWCGAYKNRGIKVKKQ